MVESIRLKSTVVEGFAGKSLDVELFWWVSRHP